jgi:5-methylcytosine-specific restriction endonuclease McrA
MPADEVFADFAAFAVALRELHIERREQVVSYRTKRLPRGHLTNRHRRAILEKTSSRCHICGGIITDRDWQADHVLAHGTGGEHSLDNYLAAHSTCNNYRWHYTAEEFQWILKLGVWARTEIERQTRIGRHIGEKFCEKEVRRAQRRMPKKLVRASS